jgi:hypothetical protein
VLEEVGNRHLPVRIYEGKKPIITKPEVSNSQDASRQLEDYLILSASKEAAESRQRSASRKVSPVKKNFIEQLELQ